MLIYLEKGAKGAPDIAATLHAQMDVRGARPRPRPRRHPPPGGHERAPSQDAGVKLLNLCHDWLSSLLPFVLSKVDRVSFGLLKDGQISQERREPRSRLLLAVPFVGKDVASRSSEFSHPDVAIGLSSLAYRYEGLRKSDFKRVLQTLVESLGGEFGAYAKRPRASAGGAGEAAGPRVRGTTFPFATEEAAQLRGRKLPRASTDPEAIKFRQRVSVWPLQYVDPSDALQRDTLYALLRSLPELIEYYLLEYVFPITMEAQGLKLSASGQDLGGGMLFGRRVGFSGTPSELMPVELGRCQYEDGTDGEVLSVLTDSSIVSTERVGGDWDPESLLRRIASDSQAALIDTGALITGSAIGRWHPSLLREGLQEHDGVVFLDEQDRQVIMTRGETEGEERVTLLSRSGVPIDRRFTFYDHAAYDRHGHQAAAGRLCLRHARKGHGLSRLRARRLPNARHW